MAGNPEEIAPTGGRSVAQVPEREITLFGLLGSIRSVDPVLERIRNLGISDQAIEIDSTVPLPNLPPATGLVSVPLIAGVIGIGIGIFFAGGTAALYPLVTGGKPIVARPVVAIISYETMMLSAIVMTLLSLVIAVRRLTQRRRSRDPRIDDGAIGIFVRIDGDGPRAESLERLFREHGAIEVQRL